MKAYNLGDDYQQNLNPSLHFINVLKTLHHSLLEVLLLANVGPKGVNLISLW
jgi:hypothetical protein